MTRVVLDVCAFVSMLMKDNSLATNLNYGVSTGCFQQIRKILKTKFVAVVWGIRKTQ